MLAKTTDQTTVVEYGPWRVTTRTIRTVERVKQRPPDDKVQPVFKIVEGRPQPVGLAVPQFLPDSHPRTVPRIEYYNPDGREGAEWAAKRTGVPEWVLWAEWLAVYRDRFEREMPPLRPLSRPRAGRRRKGAADAA